MLLFVALRPTSLTAAARSPQAGRSDDAIERIGQCYERVARDEASPSEGESVDADEKMKGSLACTIMYNMGAMLLNAGKAAEAKGCFEQVQIVRSSRNV